MFLFILESIGTSELILIAVVALIVFGPRKLPQMAKTVAKTMAEFKNATNEFKATWEKEVSFEEDNKGETKSNSWLEKPSVAENSIGANLRYSDEKPLIIPEVKELNSAISTQTFKDNDIKGENLTIEEDAYKNSAPTKRDWL